MQLNQSNLARRKFLGWLGIFSVAGVAGSGIFSRAKATPKTVKMLTEDGKLVEVDVKALNGSRRRVTDKELQSWIKK